MIFLLTFPSIISVLYILLTKILGIHLVKRFFFINKGQFKVFLY